MRERSVKKQGSIFDSETHRRATPIHVESPSDFPSPSPFLVLSDSALSSVCLSSPRYRPPRRDSSITVGHMGKEGTVGTTFVGHRDL